MYHTEAKTAAMPVREFLTRYREPERFLRYCKDCKNYAALWSCPPLALEGTVAFSSFSRVHLVGVKVIYDAGTIAAADTAVKVRAVTFESLQSVKRRLFEAMLTAEQSQPGSRSFSSGGCHLCAVCTRPEGKLCRQPQKMRYSLDAFGFDLTRIAQDALGIELQWPKSGLPAYYTLVHALLTKDEAPDCLRSVAARRFDAV